MSTSAKKKKYLKKSVERKPADFSAEGIANLNAKAKKRYSIVNIIFGAFITLLAMGAVVTIICPYVTLGSDFQEIMGYEMLIGLKGDFMSATAYKMLGINFILWSVFVLTIVAGVFCIIFKNKLWAKIATTLIFLAAAFAMFFIVEVMLSAGTTDFVNNYNLLNPAQWCEAPYIVGCGYILCAFLAFFKDDFAKATIKKIA